MNYLMMSTTASRQLTENEEISLIYDYCLTVSDTIKELWRLVRRLIEKVAVHEDKFTVEFKSSMILDVNA